eukprot:9481047-Pyramimonas_sp.AAC.1
MAAHPRSVSTQRRRQVAAGTTPKENPTDSQVYKKRSSHRAEQRDFGGCSPDDLSRFAREFMPRPSDRIWRLTTEWEKSKLDDKIFVFRSRMLTNAGVDLLRQQGARIRLCCDATHDL